MKRFGFTAGGAVVLALTASATAHAQTKLTEAAVTPIALQTADAAPPSLPFSAPAAKKSLQLDAKGRWGLRLDMEKPSARAMDWKDVEAGAYYRITPRLRVGGSVGLGDKLADGQRITPAEAAAPRVHLETSFKF